MRRNRFAINDKRGLAPKGWHIPTDAEWTQLTEYLGGANLAGGKLKEGGTWHWISPNSGATNETGFTALPGGYRLFNGMFYNIGSNGYWWSSTDYNTYYAWHRFMYYYNSDVIRYYDYKEMGFSVCCVKD